MGKYPTKMIGCNLTEIGRTSAETCNACSRIACTTTGHFSKLSLDAAIEQFCSITINQVHGTFDDTIGLKERVFSARKNIDNGVANAKNVECSHELVWGSPFCLLPASLRGIQTAVRRQSCGAGLAF